MQNNHWAWLKDERGRPLTPEQLPGTSGICWTTPTAPWRGCCRMRATSARGAGLFRRVRLGQLALASRWAGSRSTRPTSRELLAEAKAPDLAAAKRRHPAWLSRQTVSASTSQERRAEGSCTKARVDIYSRLAMIQVPLVSAEERKMANQHWQRYMLEAENALDMGALARPSASISRPWARCMN